MTRNRRRELQSYPLILKAKDEAWDMFVAMYFQNLYQGEKEGRAMALALEVADHTLHVWNRGGPLDPRYIVNQAPHAREVKGAFWDWVHAWIGEPNLHSYGQQARVDQYDRFQEIRRQRCQP